MNLSYASYLYYEMGHAHQSIRNEFTLNSVIALDLQLSFKYFHENLSCFDRISYLDVNQPSSRRFNQCYYINHLDNCLNSFLCEFEFVLLNLLASYEKVYFQSTLFDALLEIEPSAFSEHIIFRYLKAFAKSHRFMIEPKAVELFDKISSVLYDKKYSSCHLAAALMHAVCFDRYLPSSTLLVRPVRKFNYVLNRTKLYCHNIGQPDLFRQFRKVNSVSPCLRTGRVDALAAMLRYGNWRDFSENDVFEWIMSCSHDIPVYLIWQLVDYLSAGQYSIRRYALVLHLFYTFNDAARSRIRQQISTVKFLWKSIPDAYVTSREMYTMLRVIISPAARAYVKEICKMYRRNIYAGQLKPRRLMHYARCAIRSALDLNSSLPEGIEQLNIPTSCCAYLKLR